MSRAYTSENSVSYSKPREKIVCFETDSEDESPMVRYKRVTETGLNFRDNQLPTTSSNMGQSRINNNLNTEFEQMRLNSKSKPSNQFSGSTSIIKHSKGKSCLIKDSDPYFGPSQSSNFLDKSGNAARQPLETRKVVFQDEIENDCGLNDIPPEPIFTNLRASPSGNVYVVRQPLENRNVYANRPTPTQDDPDFAIPAYVPRNSNFGSKVARNFERENNNNNNNGPLKYTQVNTRQKKPKRQTFEPAKQTEEELYADENRIDPASNFEANQLYEEAEVTGGDQKKLVPIDTFAECDFFSQLRKNMEKLKWILPFQIQRYVIPIILRKEFDLMAQAQTGSGKTAAFLLPIIQKIHQIKSQKNFNTPNNHFPMAIIISPARELSQQIYNDTIRLTLKTDISVTICTGDTPMRSIVNSEGCDICVATIGRLIHYIELGNIKLNNVRFLVLDEADKLMQASFYDNIVWIKQHRELCPRHLTFMFSATFSDEVQNVATKFLRDDLFFVFAGKRNCAVSSIKQDFLWIEQNEKHDALISILKETSQEIPISNGVSFKAQKTIIFVDKRRKSDWLACILATNGFNVMSIHGDRTPKQRWEAVNQFRKGVYQILVSTDVGSRGLNFPKVARVINYDLPMEPITYIHRIGRTGRVGHIGHAISFCDLSFRFKTEDALFYIKLQTAKQDVPKFLLDIAEKNDRSWH